MEPDALQENSDWLKSVWPLPPYGSKAFLEQLEESGTTIAQFKRMPVYTMAVANGVIVDDKWVGWHDWGVPYYNDDVDLETQLDIRIGKLRDEFVAIAADAQNEANRSPTQEEAGAFLLEFIRSHQTAGIDADDIVIDKADTAGIDGLTRANSVNLWAGALGIYSDPLVKYARLQTLPEVWIKAGARATYYPKRNLVVVPHMSQQSFPQFVHAAAHVIERWGRNLDAIDTVRNRLALPGTLHMIRPDLFALRGPWLDQHDGALRGYDLAWLEQQYDARRSFTRKEIAHLFKGRPSEFLAMAAQRVARQDTIEIANLWARVPEQLLLFLAVSGGSFVEGVA
jgi:hypothetical protein